MFSRMRASEYMSSKTSAQMFGERKMWSRHPRKPSVSVENSGGGSYADLEGERPLLQTPQIGFSRIDCGMFFCLLIVRIDRCMFFVLFIVIISMSHSFKWWFFWWWKRRELRRWVVRRPRRAFEVSRHEFVYGGHAPT